MRESVREGAWVRSRMIKLTEKYAELHLVHTDSREFHHLIDNALISKIFYQAEHDTRNAEMICHSLASKDFQHNQLVDYVISQLIKTKLDNRIAKGYELGAADGLVINKSNSFLVSFLKSAPWKIVCSAIGHEQFVHLLLYYNCFLKVEKNGVVNHIQLFGETYLRNYNSSESYSDKYVVKNRMMYKEEHQIRKLNPIPLSRALLMSQVFPLAFSHSSKGPIPKKYRKFAALLTKLIKNHHSCKYPYIVDSICPAIEFKNKDINEVGTSLRKVIEFVVCVVDKIFPIEMFGSRHNKHVVMSKIATFVRSSRLNKLPRHTLLDDIKIKDVEWALSSTSTGSNLSKQDFIKRKVMLESFLYWMLGSFVSKLVACFFHVTEVLDTSLFYRHHLWKKLTKPFMDKYFSKCLDRLSESLPEFSFVESEKIQGKMKLIPKHKEFRVINAPFTGTKDESYQYWKFLNQEIRPVRKILLEARRQKLYSSQFCFSIGDIPKQVSRFRGQLLQKHGKIGELYYIKFDAKSCYDTIPKEKVKQCSRKLVAKGNTYIYRYVSTGTKLGKFSPTGILTTFDDLEKLDVISTGGFGVFKNKYILDQSRSVVLTAEDLLKIIDQQLDNTVVMVKKRRYGRQNGIFQGFPLSSTFCDVVYDDLVETHLGYILQDPESLLLRIADDFLVISTDADKVRRVFEQTRKGFGEFNVQINNDKTSFKLKPGRKGANEVVFCGLTLDLRQLNVIKTDSSYGDIIFHGKRYSELYDKLVWLFKTRINNYIIESNSVDRMEINLINCLHVLKNTMRLFYKYHKGKEIKEPFDELQFVSFCNRIFDITWIKLKIGADYNEASLCWKEVLHHEFTTIIFETLAESKF